MPNSSTYATPLDFVSSEALVCSTSVFAEDSLHKAPPQTGEFAEPKDWLGVPTLYCVAA